jgi:hypothetical protein
MDLFFQSTEQDEISGGLLPSFRNNAASSIHHEVTEVNYHEKVSKFHSSRREDRVAVARPSTIVDSKVWKIEDDEILRVISEKNLVGGKIINWTKISKDVNKHRSKSFFALTPKECEQRYHNISKVSVDKLWTDKEIQKLIELHQKYKNNWKIIANKMPGTYSLTSLNLYFKTNNSIGSSKTSKQCKYKIESMSSAGRDPIKAREIQKIKDNNPYDYAIPESKEDREYGKMSSAELYKNMINSNSQSGSSGESSLSNKNNMMQIDYQGNDKLGIIDEEASSLYF